MTVHVLSKVTPDQQNLTAGSKVATRTAARFDAELPSPAVSSMVLMKAQKLFARG